MLDTLRKSVTGPFVKILIGILILSFAVWGIQDIFGNFKKTVAIEIDDYEVSLDQLVTEYNNQLSIICLLYTSPSPRDAHEYRMPSSA